MPERRQTFAGAAADLELALRALGAAYLDALAQAGARVVIALDAGARRLDPPTPGDRP